LTVSALAQDTTHFGFGSPATQQELGLFIAIPPDGRGLPPGSGDAGTGARIYA
jgi:cytochrome c